MKPTRKCKLQAAILASAGFLFASTAAHAATAAVTVAAGTKTTNTGSWAAGWQFTVSESINVTHLGRFDYEANGINGIPGADVALYEGSTQIATIDLSGASFELSGAYRAYYAAITPVTLTTGNTYTIAAVNTGEAIFWGPASASTFASEVTFVKGIAASGASLPGTWTSTSPSLGTNTPGYYGGTFKFDAVPEPSAALLGGLGMLALLRRRR